ncbi:MAG: hypothetical protein N4J56_000728 [Chroococcidiopsis sp. SAG 2025]|uniref:hypothetical protein n=1 Tax=Chroococcidiopsis sp. SAG 2025 TaxID=171389 RepID=UPI002936D6DB|nr:hypothetical protein [Chroococcidiopsis sp. SAG 2025]MDV2991074.1 hypothetical protein [Chroococcidiopsis sp. SAG 2025]
MRARWEIGSEFDWSELVLLQSTSHELLPNRYELFSTGTAALLSLSNVIQKTQTERLRLHVPSFYCMEVVAKLERVFDICWYQDLPTESRPNFSSLNPSSGDLVLAVNTFGIREAKVWQDWLVQQNDIILIEDHSHDPFSLWAQQSIAHYAMASLRKTLPIPDGAIIWSPRAMQLPTASSSESLGAYKRLTAMLLKKAYLSGINISKDVYRRLDVESQVELGNETHCAISTFTSTILSHLNIAKFRQQREANIRQFIDLIPATVSGWMPLFTSWSAGAVPFNIIIVCKDREMRDALRNYSIEHQIFPAIHWQQPKKQISSNDILAIELSKRILTIPADQRYTSDDIEQMMETLLGFSKSPQARKLNCVKPTNDSAKNYEIAEDS